MKNETYDTARVIKDGICDIERAMDEVAADDLFLKPDFCRNLESEERKALKSVIFRHLSKRKRALEKKFSELK